MAGEEIQGILQKVFDNVNNALRINSVPDFLSWHAGDFVTIAGAPTSVVTNGYPRTGLPDAATTTLGWTFYAPPTWLNFQMGFFWTPSVGSNNVRMEMAVKKTALAIDNVNEAFVNDTLATLGAPATPGVVAYANDFLSATISNTGDAFGSIYAVNLSRIGADAADTNTGVVEICGAYARKV